MITETTFDFLLQLSKNNTRDWFAAHKTKFDKERAASTIFFNEVAAELQKIDSIEHVQIFRIYRDIRFSKDKSPYKNHFSVGFTRTKPQLRGGMYLHIEPNKSFVGGGFWAPNPTDLYRIRKEIEFDYEELQKITNDKAFIKYFGTLQGESLKTAPKGFDKNHPAISLLQKKQFLLSRNFTDKEVVHSNFKKEVIETFKAMRPFFDYMSNVLGTDLNGESLY